MAGTVLFRRIAVIGTGLIGGSFALALRKHFPGLLWWVTPALTPRGKLAIVAQSTKRPRISPAQCVAPTLYTSRCRSGRSIETLPAIAAAAEPHALSHRLGQHEIRNCPRGWNHFRTGARFLGGHPMAGKELSGIEHADAELFRNAPYALIAPEGDPDPRVKHFAELIRAMGAQPVWSDAETHDWAVGIVSHLPQLLSVALANVVQDETDETGLPLTLRGRACRICCGSREAPTKFGATSSYQHRKYFACARPPRAGYRPHQDAPG